MLEIPGEGVNLRKSAVFCENLHFRLSLSVTLVLSLSLSLCHLSSLAWLPLQSLAVKKKLFFGANFGR